MPPATSNEPQPEDRKPLGFRSYVLIGALGVLGPILLAAALGFALLSAGSSRFQGVAAESEAEVSAAAATLADLKRFERAGGRRAGGRIETSLRRATRFDDEDERRAAERALAAFEIARAELRRGAAGRARFNRALDSAQRRTIRLVDLGAEELRAELSVISAEQRRDRVPLYLALVLGLPLTAAAIWMFSRRVTQPLDRLRDGAQRLSGGEYGHRVRLEGPAEAHSVAIAFNRMAESLGASRRILEDRAVRDPLTGLVNRNLLASRTHAAIERAAAGPAPTMLFIDLDRFKAINDSLGHAVGDEVLQHVGRRLRRALRDEATVGRVGGDEFAVLVEWQDGQGPGAGSAAIAERILDAIATPYEVDRREFLLSASIGIAHGEPAMSFDELLRNADLAMYAGRKRGAGSYAYFEPSMLMQTVVRMDKVTALREAVDRGALGVQYQLVVDLPGNRPLGVEALACRTDAEHGVIAAADFIPLAEEKNLIVPLGEWVLREACRQAVAWDEERPGAGEWQMSVNLSPRQLFDPNLTERVESALADSGLPAERLMLEITEAAIMRDVDVATARLGALRELGVGLALDEFGSGHSSLSDLRHLPVTQVKVARDLVGRIAEGPRDLALVEGIVSLAHGLGHRVVAAGIETPAQFELVTAVGCDMGQGFHIARPAPAADLATARVEPIS